MPRNARSRKNNAITLKKLKQRKRNSSKTVTTTTRKLTNNSSNSHQNKSNVSSKQTTDKGIEIRLEMKLLQQDINYISEFATIYYSIPPLVIKLALTFTYCLALFGFDSYEVMMDLISFTDNAWIYALPRIILNLVVLKAAGFLDEAILKLIAGFDGQPRNLLDNLLTEDEKQAYETNFRNRDLSSQEAQEINQHLKKIQSKISAQIAYAPQIGLTAIGIPLALQYFELIDNPCTYIASMLSLKYIFNGLKKLYLRYYSPTSLGIPATTDTIALKLLNQFNNIVEFKNLKWQRYQSVQQTSSRLKSLYLVFKYHVSGQYHQSHWYHLQLTNTNQDADIFLKYSYLLQLIKSQEFEIIITNDEQLTVHVPVNNSLSANTSSDNLKKIQYKWSKLKQQHKELNDIKKNLCILFNNDITKYVYQIEYQFHDESKLHLGLSSKHCKGQKARNYLIELQKIFGKKQVSNFENRIMIFPVDTKRTLDNIKKTPAPKVKNIAHLAKHPDKTTLITTKNSDKITSRITAKQHSYDTSNLNHQRKKPKSKLREQQHKKIKTRAMKPEWYLGQGALSNIPDIEICLTDKKQKLETKHLKIRAKHFVKVAGAKNTYLLWNKAEIINSKFYKSAIYKKYKSIALDPKLCRSKRGKNGIALFDKQNGPKLKWVAAPNHKRLKLNKYQSQFNNNKVTTVYEVTGQII